MPGLGLRLECPRAPPRQACAAYDHGMHLLVVEDEDTIAEPLVEGLRDEGFEVTRVATGQEAIDAPPADLVLLDVRLPDIDGFAVCRELRARSDVPIIMVTAKGEEIDRVVGLEIGADDYVVKPYGLRELIARIRAVARRSSGRQEPRDTIVAGPLEVDVPARRATIEGRELAAHRQGVRPARAARIRAGDRRRPTADPARGVGHDLVRVVEDGRRARRRSAQEARRPDPDRDSAGDRLAAARMTRRLLLSYLSLTIVVLAMLEVPLGFVNARGERAQLSAKVERDAVTVASLAESTVEGDTGTSDLPALKALARRYAADTGARVVIVDDQGVALVDSAPLAPGRRTLRDAARVPGGAERRRGDRGAQLEHAGLRHSLRRGADRFRRRHPRRRAHHLPDVGGRPARPQLLARARRDRRRSRSRWRR